MLTLARLLLWLLPLAPAAPRAPGGCTCSSGMLPVPVDVVLAADPANPLGLAAPATRRLATTLSIFGVLCQPVPPHPDPSLRNAVQLLLHGQTYTTHYWDVPWGGFENYSYVAHACARGIASFAYDNAGAGRSVRPANSTDCQMPTAAAVASALARGLQRGRVAARLTGRGARFRTVVGVGHSLGAATLNYAALRDGAASPFAALLLTGSVHDPEFLQGSPVVTRPAREVDPLRWGALDPGYITTPDAAARRLFYGADAGAFAPAALALDELTKDAGARWLSLQVRATYAPAAGFAGRVAALVGARDAVHCRAPGGCVAARLQAAEAPFWPDARNLTVAVIDGAGHDLNLMFSAAEAFRMMTAFFESVVQ